MNEYRIRATGKVVTEQDFRLASKKVYPQVIDAALANELGIDPILSSPIPVIGKYERAVRDGVTQDALGNWVQAWKVESAYNTKDEEAAAKLADLNKVKDIAIAKTYTDVDAIYDAAIGRRQSEYTEAEAAARAYLADPTAPVSGYVSGFAVDNPTGQVQTDEWSAKQIIGRAEAFRAAQLAMRTVRFTAQKAMRAAVNEDLLSEVVADWNGFIARIRLELGL